MADGLFGLYGSECADELATFLWTLTPCLLSDSTAKAAATSTEPQEEKEEEEEEEEEEESEEEEEESEEEEDAGADPLQEPQPGAGGGALRHRAADQGEGGGPGGSGPGEHPPPLLRDDAAGREDRGGVRSEGRLRHVRAAKRAGFCGTDSGRSVTRG